MGQTVKTFEDGAYLEYDQGKFDGWCVYLTKRDGSRRSPTDVDYFVALRRLADKYDAGQIYSDFVRVYDLTGKQLERDALSAITRIASDYGQGALLVDKVLSTLYMTMIAEENKQFSRLGKRIKRLGVHQVLIENQSVEHAAHSTRGKAWRDIDKLCKERGF